MTLAGLVRLLELQLLLQLLLELLLELLLLLHPLAWGFSSSRCRLLP